MEVAAGLWIGANVLIAAGLGVAGLLRLRAVLGARDTVWRWTVGLTAVGVAIAYGVMELVARDLRVPLGQTGLDPLAVPAALMAMLLIVPILLTGSWIGASAGALVPARGASRSMGARRGVTQWWLTMICCSAIGAAAASASVGGLVVSAMVCSTPVLTLIGLRTASAPAPWLDRMWRRLAPAMSRTLLVTVARRGHVRIVDLRGAAIGAAAGAVTLLAGAAGLLGPLQSRAMISLMHFENTVAELAQGAQDGAGENRIRVSTTRSTEGRMRSAAELRSRFVMVRLDGAARRRALTTGSEAAVQAQAIGALMKHRPAAIVLPAPATRLRDLGFTMVATGPMPDDAGIRRCLQDLPVLAKACKSAGRVILGLLPADAPSRALDGLQQAVWQAAPWDMTTSAAYGVPAATVATDRQSVAWLMTAVMRGSPPSVQVRSGTLARIAGARTRLDGRGEMLIAFQSTDLANDFPSTTYDQVLSREPVYMPAMNSPGRWLSLAAAVRGRIVVLDGFAAGSLRTPEGDVAPGRAAAYAAVLAAGEDAPGMPAPWLVPCLTIGAGAVIGHAGLRRTPLYAGLNALFLSAAPALVALFTYGATRTFVDPSAPLVGIWLAFALTVQFTLAVVHSERSKSRLVLERFVAPTVVREMLDDPEAVLELTGERQFVAILFADIRGFSAFAETHPAEMVVEVTNAYLSALTDRLTEHHGILDKYTGDGLMAILRLEDGRSDGVARAVSCAISMRDAAGEVSGRLEAEGKPSLGMGFSLHCGEPVVGLIGSERQWNYTALGECVVIAARLQGLAGAGEVIVSDAVAEAVAGRFRMEERPHVQVKGLSEPVRPFRVVGPKVAALPPVAPGPQSAPMED